MTCQPDNGGCWAEDFAASEAGNIALLTEHYYISNYSSAAPSISGMLTYPGPGPVGALQNLQTAASANHVLVRIDECNTYFASKEPTGVANAFAAALWAIDSIFTNAQYGSSGVNFHNTGNTPGYAAIGESDSAIASVQPLYYGMFLFSKLFPLGEPGVLLESTLTVSGVALTAFALGFLDGTRVVLNNKDSVSAANVTISGFAPWSRAALLTTLASAGDTPSQQLANLGIYNGGGPITFGGEPFALNVQWNGRPTEMPVSGGSLTVAIQPATGSSCVWTGPLSPGANCHGPRRRSTF